MAFDRGFEAELAETIRTRSRWIWGVSIVVWVISFFGFDLAVFPSYAFAARIRVPEIILALGFSWWLRKPRALRALEATQVAAWAFMASISVYGLSVVPAEKLPAKVASLAISVLVVCPLAAFGWRATIVIGVITVAALSSLRFMGHPDLATLALTSVGFAYGVLVVGAAARDRLKRSEYDARQALSAANEKLKNEDELRRRLFVNLSHDFRTPLTVIRGEASLMRAAGRAPEEASALYRIEANARALADLTDQLIELAKLEAGQVARRPRNCNLVAFARDVAALLEPPGATRRIVTAATTGDDLIARVDPNHVQRILLNLVANGLRHASGEVTMRVGAAGDRVFVEVSDEGPGIPEERREAIFQRFVTFSADGSTSSGIGLPLARELAILNGGALALLDGAPRTTFRLELPKAEGPADESVSGNAAHLAPVAVPESTPPRAAEGARPPVLVVEDNPDMAALLLRVLSPRFDVRHESTVAGAREALATSRPTAVLSDVMLPDGSGYDVLATVRGARDHETLPVVLVSALGEVNERVRGLAAGADDYIAKPFAPEELERRLMSALERAESRRRALELQRDALLMEIHDGVSASLSRAAILLADPDQADSATHAREAIRDGLEEVRAITRLLSPRGSDWRTLVAEIRRAMADACAANSLKLEFEAEELADPPPVPAAVAHTMRRIAREATTNAIKHSRARTIRCRLQATPEWTLRFEDDGRGFPEDTARGQGLGIMSRRVARIGGKLELGNRPSGGAFIAATLGRE